MVAVNRRAPKERAGGRLRHRPDLDGLRAVAILLVVGYHAHVPGFGAGFVGVDVLFVLSGFLITGLIVAENDETGSLDLGRFWAGRARRLLPASLVTIGVVILASQMIESPLRWKGTIDEGLAAMLYWSNHLFADQANNYFAADLYATPLLHMWSLAVAAQFYMVWPLVLWLPSRWVSSDRTVARARLVAVGSLVASSLLISQGLTNQDSSLAFYGAASRAWEFGAGALLALVLGPGGSVRSALARRALTVTGVGLLVLASVVIDSGSPFPMWTATMPVLGSVCLIAAEPTRGVVGGALFSEPAQVVGRLSYSWYLWQWPVIVLGTQYLGSDAVLVRVGLAGLALLPAAVSRAFIETPIRRSARLSESVRATVSVIVIVMLVVVLIASAAMIRTSQVLDDPLLEAVTFGRTDTTDLRGPCTSTDVEIVAQGCVGGDPRGSRLVLVLGDSHAAHWMPAVDAAAGRLGWRMTASVLGDCPSIEVVFSRGTQRCRDRGDRIGQLIDALAPDLVVMSHSVGYLGGLQDPIGPSDPAVDQASLWERELAVFARSLQDHGIDFLVVLDVPRFESNPLECVARARDTAPCDLDLVSARERLAPFHEAEIRALSTAGHGRYLDPLKLLCSETSCPVMVDGLVAYADRHHLTTAISRHLADEIGEAMIGSAPVGVSR